MRKSSGGTTHTNDGFQTGEKNRNVDVLVNPPLTLYLVTEKKEVTKNLDCKWNDEDVVLPVGEKSQC